MSPILAHPPSLPAALFFPPPDGRRSTPESTVAEERSAHPRLTPTTAEEGPARSSDEDLLRRYRDTGGADEFDELFRRYSGELHRHLTRYLGGPTQAEDVLQNTFLQVHAKCRMYHDGRPARPWLYAIARHQAVDALRRAGRQAAVSLDRPSGAAEPSALAELLAGEGPDPLEELQAEERQRWVRDSIDRLPETLRQVVVLAYDKGLKYTEIAEVLEIPLGTVKTRLHTAIIRLRAMARAAQLVGSY
ncbi:MAG: sigma-70 family RNA polymerase sigma factor [Planctomycetaceae bacterium]|nr:sigma-70 family RNA polymerase sigma factor [Planctomycetaceae bacterium]MBV8316123.1 sigma-70 family RNA polymerase sigma factor [Planctomycetaceae bacterium]MBV8383768.1 sigma-70 family RNA polymerase sigma factor [Planctomycetaceae bacterium]MBV8555568.1 sigma-70 family RNA polymerase sigma factor [Planctomycetaceae bacterium]